MLKTLPPNSIENNFEFGVHTYFGEEVWAIYLGVFKDLVLDGDEVVVLLLIVEHESYRRIHHPCLSYLIHTMVLTFACHCLNWPHEANLGVVSGSLSLFRIWPQESNLGVMRRITSLRAIMGMMGVPWWAPTCGISHLLDHIFEWVLHLPATRETKNETRTTQD